MAVHPEDLAPDRLVAPVGVVLAGGGSRRLGRDKTQLEIDGRTLPQRAVDRLREVCESIILADAGRQLLADVESVPDGPAAGPAGGILGVAARFPDRPLLVLACDLPKIPVSLLADLAQPRVGIEWTVPRWQRGIEPLCALYGPTAIERLERLAESGNPALHRLTGIADLHIHWLQEGALEHHGRPETMFLNVNTPDDLRRLHPAR